MLDGIKSQLHSMMDFIAPTFVIIYASIVYAFFVQLAPDIPYIPSVRQEMTFDPRVSALNI